MARAVGVDLAFDQEVGPFAVRPVGVFLESLDGAQIEYEYLPDIQDEADDGDPGFVTYWQTVEALGDLPTWWKTIGLQREVGLLDSLAEAGQLITPREWLVWHAEHSSWFGIKLFVLFDAPDEITISELYAQVMDDEFDWQEAGDESGFPDFDLVGLRPDLETRGDTYPHREWALDTISMVAEGVVGYRFPRAEDGSVIIAQPDEWVPCRSGQIPAWAETEMLSGEELRREVYRRAGLPLPRAR
ncbi:MAG: hypothetical protein OXD34_11950 [bacterium]|nr:hypothetical protein [bacterium]